MSRNLFDVSNDSDNDLNLTTNEDYAKTYNSFRKKELLKKFTDRGYTNVNDSFSSSDSSESTDEDERLDAKFDKEFFKILASLKSKNPSIYDKNTEFFKNFKSLENECMKNDEYAVHKKKGSKPVTLKDFERKVMLERGGKFEDSDEDLVSKSNQRSASPTVFEEEQLLKEEFKKVINTEDTEDEEFGGIFKKRTKTKAEKDKDDEDFTKWLAGSKEEIDDNNKQNLEPLKTYWSNNKLPQSERFLRDYILNNGYSNTDSNEIPTYEEIVGDNTPLSEDERELEKQAEFEHKYNFRFEEPDTEFIKRYPRTIESSVRRTDDKRKQKRQELKDRKIQERDEKMKHLEIVKEMKRKEVEEKIRMLKMVTGNEELGFKDEELEEDFDPEVHDRRMNDIFNDEYYLIDEGEEKPECPSDVDDLQVEDWDSYNHIEALGNDDDNGKEPHCEDEDFNMDCDFENGASKHALQNELIGNTRSRRNHHRRKNRFMEMIQAKKPAFNPDDEKTYADYIDEYYKMDCEDIIGDLPCRFKYVETTPCDFGLSIEEILLAKNKELNQWASLKKAIQIRPDYVEMREQKMYKLKAKNEELKRKIFKSLYGDGVDDDENKGENKASPDVDIQVGTTKSIEKSNKKRSRKRRIDNEINPTTKTLPTTNTDNTINIEGLKDCLKNKSSIVVEKVKGEPKIKETVRLNTIQTKSTTFEFMNNRNPFKSATKSKHQNLPSVNENERGKKGVKKHKNTKGVYLTQNGSTEISNERLKAYGINPRKFHKKQKYEKKYN